MLQRLNQKDSLDEALRFVKFVAIVVSGGNRVLLGLIMGEIRRPCFGFCSWSP